MTATATPRGYIIDLTPLPDNRLVACYGEVFIAVQRNPWEETKDAFLNRVEGIVEFIERGGGNPCN